MRAYFRGFVLLGLPLGVMCAGAGGSNQYQYGEKKNRVVGSVRTAVVLATGNGNGRCFSIAHINCSPSLGTGQN